jgi:hypothetical protein
MKTLFSYERQTPLTKLVLAIEDQQLYCSFFCKEVCERLIDSENPDGLAKVDDYEKKQLLDFVGYLLFSRQMNTKDALHIRALVRVHFGVEHEVLWQKGIEYIPLLNDSKLLFGDDDLTLYSFESKAHPHNNYPIEYYVDHGIHGSYSVTEKEAKKLMATK